MICLIVVSRHSDRTLERRYHSALPCLACRRTRLDRYGLRITRSIAFAALVLATLGPVTAGASFWQFPPMLLAGTAAAGGIALINSIRQFLGLGGAIRDRVAQGSDGDDFSRSLTWSPASNCLPESLSLYICRGTFPNVPGFLMDWPGL